MTRLIAVLFLSVFSLQAASFRAVGPVAYFHYNAASGYSLVTNDVTEVRGLSADGSTLVVGVSGYHIWARIRIQGADVTESSIHNHWDATGDLSSNGDSALINGEESGAGSFRARIAVPFTIWDTIGVGISSDGQTVAGYFGSFSPPGPFAGPGFIATTNELTSFQGTIAFGLSPDGQVMLGRTTNTYEACYATTNSGAVAMGYLAGDSGSVAYKISADNQTIIGVSGQQDTYGIIAQQAFRWTSNDGMVGLGYLAGDVTSTAKVVTADGKIIVGSSSSTNASHAMIWDGTNGMRSVTQVLQNAGIDMTGWQLTEVTAISADGLLIAGNGVNPNGQAQGWIAWFGDSLATPSNVSATCDFSGTNLVTWQGVADATGYRIERKVGNNGSWIEVGTVGKTNAYVDGQISITNCAYRVRAANLASDSAPSAETQCVYPSLLFQNPLTGKLKLWHANNTNFAGSQLIESAVSLVGWRAVCIRDFTGDDQAEVLMQRSNGQIGLLFLNETNATNLLLLNEGKKVSTAWRLVGAADYNNDKKLDLVWQRTDGYVQVWFMDGTNFVSSQFMFEKSSVPLGWRLAALDTFSLDKVGDSGSDTTYPDFLLQNGRRLAIWYIQGLAFKASQSLGNLPIGCRAVDLLDFNGTGDRDLLAQYITGSVGVWYLQSQSQTNVTMLQSSILFNGKSPGATWRLIGVYQ